MEKNVKDAIKDLQDSIYTIRKAVLMLENVRYKHTKNIYNILQEYNKILKKQASTKETKKIDKEIKEIENIISLGIPGWVNYTRKEKKIKK